MTYYVIENHVPLLCIFVIQKGLTFDSHFIDDSGTPKANFNLDRECVTLSGDRNLG